jgi:hypothetical protein
LAMWLEILDHKGTAGTWGLLSETCPKTDQRRQAARAGPFPPLFQAVLPEPGDYTLYTLHLSQAESLWKAAPHFLSRHMSPCGNVIFILSAKMKGHENHFSGGIGGSLFRIWGPHTVWLKDIMVGKISILIGTRMWNKQINLPRNGNFAWGYMIKCC